MKEMVYKTIRERIILDEGLCCGMWYWIISYGTHPCAYIQIPKDNRKFW